MKKTIIILAGILFVLTILIVLNPPEFSFEKIEVTEPNRPDSVPNYAFWAGGIDGGNFIQLKEYDSKNNMYFAKIYNDLTGELEYEGIMQYSENEVIEKHQLNDPAMYQGWDGEKLHLSNGKYMDVFKDDNSK